MRLASARLYDPKKSRTSRQVAAGDICDVDEKKDATSTSLTGARGPTHRSEIFHGVDCLPAQRITAHLVSERGGGVRLGSRGTSFYYPLSTGDDIFGVARGVARTSGTHESNEGCPDRASRRAPRGKPTAQGFGNPFAARSPSSRYMPTASCLFFHAAKRHGEETLETAGLHETSATNRSPVDTYEGHRPDPFEWQREHALAQTVVSVTCFAPFAMLPCTGRGANVPKKVASTRRLSAISGGTTMIWHRFAGFAPKRKRTSFLRLSCVGGDFPFRFCS